MDKNIVFIGDVERFFDGIKKSFEKTFPKESFNFYFCSDEKVYLVPGFILDKEAHIVIWNISEFSFEKFNIFLYIRSFPTLKQIPLITLVKERRKFEDNFDLLRSGVIFLYNKGIELDQLPIDCFYAAFPPSTTKLKLATAGALNFRLEVFQFFKIYKVEEKSISVYSDLQFKQSEKAFLRLPFWENNLSLKVEEQMGAPMLDSYLYKIKMEIPKGRKKLVGFHQYYVKSWREENISNFEGIRPSILIIDNKNFHYKINPKMKRFSKWRIFNIKFLDNSCLTVKDFLPDIIMYSLDKCDLSEQRAFECMNDLSGLDSLIEVVKEEKLYEPYIFVYGSNSYSQALQKAYGYKKLLGSQIELDLSGVIEVMTIFEKKYVFPAKDQDYEWVKETGQNAWGEFKLQIKIDSLNEHRCGVLLFR